MKSLNKLMLVAVFAASVTLNANALLITPTSSPQWQGSVPKNPDADDIENITGTSAELTAAYKSDQGGPDSGSFASSYNTAYSNTETDPQDASITYNSGQPVITGNPIFLLVKDGNHIPIWYIFDISGWNGMETIDLRGFWPDGGAISHVSIYTPGGTRVPDGGSTLALLGLALTSIGLLRRKLT
jgi:protein with PEP-CTERM/exosortase system signal